jgi:hypothetical protein
VGVSLAEARSVALAITDVAVDREREAEALRAANADLAARVEVLEVRKKDEEVRIDVRAAHKLEGFQVKTFKRSHSFTCTGWLFLMMGSFSLASTLIAGILIFLEEGLDQPLWLSIVLGLCGLIICLGVAYFFGYRRADKLLTRWTYVRPAPDIVHADLRADSLKLKEKEHDSRLVIFRFWTSPSHFGDLDSQDRDLVVDGEILAQVSTAAIMDLSATDEVTWQRIVHAAKSLMTVNVDRYRTLGGEAVVQHTCMLALDMWRQRVYEVRQYSFPKPQ